MTGDITLTAKWTANMASVTPPAKSVKKGKTLKLTARSGNAKIKSVRWLTSNKKNVKIWGGAKKGMVTLKGMKKGKSAKIKAVITFKDGSKKTVTRKVTVK